jgi:isoquinoline 1-oxidoreductase beta subunit
MSRLSDNAALSRRAVLQGASVAGGGLLLGFSLPRAAKAQTASANGVFAPDAFIRIGRDDRVTLIMSQVEMGQGIHTAIPMILAEELDVPLSRVTTEEAPPNDKLYGNPVLVIQMTGGSTSVRTLFTPMRKTAAAARAMLVTAAAQTWGVDAATCRTEAGAVIHDASGRRLGYGALVDAAGAVPRPENPVLKDPKTFKLIGTPAKRLDTPDKVNGKAVFGIDALPDGVRFATLASCPVFGGTLGACDEKAALAVPGVRQVVKLDTLVAVVADHMWAAKLGLAALDVQWNDGPHAALSSNDLWGAIGKASETEGVTAQKIGDVDAALKGDGVITASYELPLLAHAPMEPMNCTVHVTPDGCEIWVGIQVMTKAQRIAAAITGLRPEKITIHNHLIGGGFGRRLEEDGVGVAVRIAQHVEGPVKVVWTREEDIQHDMYRPVYRNVMGGRVENGKLVAWTHRVVGPAIIARYLPPAFKNGIDIDAVDGAIDLPYDIPNLRVDYVRHEMAGVPTAFWRGVGPNSTIFAAESFIDKLARQAGSDPLTFRRGLLAKNPRGLATLDLAAQKAGWGGAMADRTGRGIAFQFVMGSFVATIAEVAVADDGVVTVKHITSAVDCGTIINPDTVVAQIQGGLIFGLTAALHGEITIERGRVQQSNFHDYRMLRINEVPTIAVHLVPSGEAPGGIGEPGTVAAMPSVANAIYAATGVQIQRMPIDPTLLAKKRSA